MVSTEKRQFLILLRDEPLEIGYLDSYPTREGSIPSASTQNKSAITCYKYSYHRRKSWQGPHEESSTISTE